MNHISEEKLINLADIISNRLYADEASLSMMEHIKTCQDCYFQLCNYLVIADATGVIGMNSALHAIRRESVECEASYKVPSIVASFRILKNKVSEAITYSIEQIDRNNSLLFFDQPLAFATRGISATDIEGSISKLEDIENEYTYISYDPTSCELEVQICDEDYGEYELWINDSKHAFEKQASFLIANIQNVTEQDSIVIKKIFKTE